MLDTSSSENASSDNSGDTVCKYCGVDFKFSRVLRHHLRSVNNSCNRKPFVCRNCNYGFSTKNNCIRHINQRHPEFKDNVHDLIIFNQPRPTSPNQSNQVITLANTEASTEEDEHSSLYIADSECNNLNEQDDFQENLEEQNNFQAFSPKQNLQANAREQQESSSEPEQECMPENLSYNVAYDQNISSSSEDDRVSIAQSLVSLSEGHSMFQMAPLDLSVRAIDLSSKNANSIPHEKSTESCSENSRSSPFPSTREGFVRPQPAHSSSVIQSFAPEKHVNAPVSPINLIQNQSNNAMTCQLPPVAALPLIYVPQTIIASTPENLNSASPNSALYVSNNECLPGSSDTARSQNACMSQMKMVKKKLVSNERSYKCEYCDKKFTLKSNRERHVKKQHPEFARPARSRNFIPFLPEVETLKQVPNVSDTTRNLLRSVLMPKVNNNSPNIKHNEKEDVEDFAAVNESLLTTSSETLVQFEERKDFTNHSRNDFENNDLASVSSVIDTANSQGFKKYLKGANFSDLHSSSEKIASGSESEMDESKLGRRVSMEKNRESLICEYCDRPFPWISALNRHLRTHTGHKPYSCLECPITFSTKSNLDRHIKKKCCDKINFKYHKTYHGLQNEDSSNHRFQDLKNESQTQLNLETHSNFSETTIRDNPQVVEKQVSYAINGPSPSTSVKPSVAAQFNTSFNTVAHVASLRFQSLDSAQPEFECKFCRNTYKTDDDLTNHMKELHPLEYQSLTGKTTNETENTLMSWKKNFSAKKKEGHHKYESSAAQFNPPSLLAVAAEPNLASLPPNKSESDTDNNLIMNLLGVKDSKVIDEIIDCAARTRVEHES